MPARLREPVPGGCRPVAERRMRRVRWRCWCVRLLAIFVLCVQSLAAVMPALGDAHHHEPGLPHDRLHGPRAEPAMPPLMHGSAVATGSNEVEVPSAQPHRHAAVERHHHGSPADPHDRMALDDTLDPLLDDLMLRLGSVATALAGDARAGPAATAFAPVRVALAGTTLRWRPPDLPYRPPIA